MACNQDFVQYIADQCSEAGGNNCQEDVRRLWHLLQRQDFRTYLRRPSLSETDRGRAQTASERRTPTTVRWGEKLFLHRRCRRPAVSLLARPGNLWGTAGAETKEEKDYPKVLKRKRIMARPTTKAPTSKSENFGMGSRRGIFPCSLTRLWENYLHISRILTNFVYKLHIRGFVLNGFDFTKLLKINDMCNFLYIIIATF